MARDLRILSISADSVIVFRKSVEGKESVGGIFREYVRSRQ